MTDQQDNWIKAQVEIGHYGSDNLVVQKLILERQLREQENDREIESIRAKLIQAEKSGLTDQRPEDLLKKIKNGT